MDPLIPEEYFKISVFSFSSIHFVEGLRLMSFIKHCESLMIAIIHVDTLKMDEQRAENKPRDNFMNMTIDPRDLKSYSTDIHLNDS